jgi:hypothetical protein
LQDVGHGVVEQARHDDVAALDQAQAARALAAGAVTQEIRRPLAGGVDERARPQPPDAAIGTAQGGEPAGSGVTGSDGADAFGARQDDRPVAGRADGVEHHQTGVIHPAVGIDEGTGEGRLERPAGLVLAEVDAFRSAQQFAPGQVVVEKQAESHHPGRPHRRVVRQHEAQRPHDVRRVAQQDFALLQGLAHQAELVVLQVAQAAVDQLGGGRGRVRCQVVFFAQHYRQPATGRVARDTRAIDAAADDQQVAINSCRQICRWHPLPGPGCPPSFQLIEPVD